MTITFVIQSKDAIGMAVYPIIRRIVNTIPTAERVALVATVVGGRNKLRPSRPPLLYVSSPRLRPSVSSAFSAAGLSPAPSRPTAPRAEGGAGTLRANPPDATSASLPETKRNLTT